MHVICKFKIIKNIPVIMDNDSMKQVHSARFLGVYIDDKMTWIDDISYMSNKLAKSIVILHWVKWTLHSQALRKLYYTLVLPCICYCAIIAGNTYYTKVLPNFLQLIKLFAS